MISRMATPPVVSVVLPYLNAESSLERAIRSILQQDFEDLELILVDNGSSDGGPHVAGKWQQKDSRIRLVSESKRGVAFASNRGCELAGGRYIARMDADDVSCPGRLRLQVEFLDKHPGCGAVAGLAEHVGDPASTGGFGRFVEWSNSLISYEEIMNRRFIELPVVNPTAMWRRTTMEKHGLYLDGDFPEDYDMWLRWLHEGVRVEKIPVVVLKWHDSESRLSRAHPSYSDQAFYRTKSRYLAKFLARSNPFHPHVWVWGASRISRRRARLLGEHGIRIAAYIDTKESRQLDQPLVHYSEIPPAGTCFILTYIRQMDNREKIRNFLEEKGYMEGKNYLMVS